MNIKLVKVISVATTLLGIGLSIATKWVDDKALDHKISAEVAKAISGKN